MQPVIFLFTSSCFGYAFQDEWHDPARLKPGDLACRIEAAQNISFARSTAGFRKSHRYRLPNAQVRFEPVDIDSLRAVETKRFALRRLGTAAARCPYRQGCCDGCVRSLRPRLHARQGDAARALPNRATSLVPYSPPATTTSAFPSALYRSCASKIVIRSPLGWCRVQPPRFSGVISFWIWALLNVPRIMIS